MEPQTQKPQITETLRQADNIIITVSANPDVDQIAAAIALTEIMTKLGKRADAVVSSDVPPQVDFLATRLLQPKFNGIRDFVISLNVSHTEADKLKYVPEGKKLNIYITPYNGNFNREDVGFSYGDYHCDAVIALGAKGPAELDKEIADQKQLLAKTKLITINVGETAPAGGGMDWHEPNASSVCELLMSLTEALQSGLVDGEIATALLTGIMAKTEHFTSAATTPKVMTMAAQLMAAGAKQADILAHLQQPSPHAAGRKGRGAKKPAAKERGALEPAHEESLRAKPAQRTARPDKFARKPEPVIPAPAGLKAEPPKPAPPPPPPKPAAPPPPQPPPQPPQFRPVTPAPVAAPPPAVNPAFGTQVSPPLTPPPVAPPRPSSIRDVKSENVLAGTTPPPVAPPPSAAAMPPLARTPVPPPAVPPQVPFENRGPGPPLGVSPPPPPPPPPAASPMIPPPPPPAENSPPPPPHVDIDTARKAVEEATRPAAPPPRPPAA